jgi:hypothetical protein
MINFNIIAHFSLGYKNMPSFQNFLLKYMNLLSVSKCYMFYPSNSLDLIILTGLNKNYIYLV